MTRRLYVERSTMLYKASRRASLAFKYLFLPFRVEQEEAPQKGKPAKRLPTFIPPPPPPPPPRSAQQPQTEGNNCQSYASELDMSDCEEDSDDEGSDESP